MLSPSRIPHILKQDRAQGTEAERSQVSDTTMSKTKTDVESAVEDTVLTDVLGPHAKVKILTALLSENDRDLNATEIARPAGIDRSTFYEHLDDLLDYR